MSFFDNLFGKKKEQPQTNGPVRFGSQPMGSLTPGGAAALNYDQAMHRYDTFMQKASPQQIEQAHAEAFAKMSPDERRQVYESLSAQLSPFERMSFQGDPTDPNLLARMAAKLETRTPGTMSRTFGKQSHGRGFGGGMGGMMGGILGGIVLGVITGMIAGAIFEELGEAFFGEEMLPEEAAAAMEDPAGYAEETASDFGGDFGGGDFGGGDFGGEF
ncbi:MAG: hypothetical protein MUD01_05225 [Chloroflexaceae bacterium]|jgi:hypothetical protein|nr:hypothetical protein [Chloroflexaceae bacterium]